MEAKDCSRAKRTYESLYRSIPVISVLFVSATIVLAAAVQPGERWQHWQASHLKSYGERLAPKMNAQKIAAEPLGKYANHSMLVSHREADGQAEVHRTQADIFFVQSGEGAIIVGGEVIAPEQSAADEVRGSGIRGGERKSLAAGDIMHISAGVPHQFLIAPGKKLTCVFVKVDEGK